MTSVARLPRWYQPFTRPATYKTVYGGRTASKTRTVAQSYVLKAMNRHVYCAATREFNVTVDKSVKKALVWAIKHLEVEHLFDIQAYKILCPHTESEFFFAGLERHPENLRGWEGVTDVWVDEAHRLSVTAAEIMIPTVLRGDNPVEMMFTWNPKYRTDWVWRRFVDNPRPGDIIRKISWRDNPWFNAQSNEERLAYKRDNPERYPHVWEGLPDDASANRKVLPYNLLQLCVDAWDRRPSLGAFRTAGLDVSDTGDDYNALALRAGPELSDISTWRGSLEFTPAHTARRAKRRVMEYGAKRFMYDAVGVGAGIRGPIHEDPKPTFRVEGCNFGGKVQAPDVNFTRGRDPQTNGEYFFNWFAQASWAVRLRAELTNRLMNGEDVDPHKCLFINPKIRNIDSVLAILAQPEWEDKTGKLKVIKQPKEAGEQAPPSPDEYDAVVLAYSSDCSRGLQELPPSSKLVVNE